MSKAEKKIFPLADDTPDESPATDSAIPPEITPLADDTPNESPTTDSAIPPEVAAELDEEEKEFRALWRDLPGVKGSSAAGIVTLSVGRIPPKNEFFRTHPDFRPIVPIVNLEVGMEKQFFAVARDMVEPLEQIGITVSDHALYLTVTSEGVVRIVPARTADDDGNQDEYTRTKEIGLIRGIQEWVRLYTDLKNKAYKVFPAPAERFGEPQFPDLKPAKMFRLGFRDKGRLIDSTEHPLFLKWAARDIDK
jgi:hypothetical protein